MTCIIGCVKDEKVWMGADSMSVNTHFLNAETSIYPKVFMKKEGTTLFLIGYTSSWRMGQILAHSLKLPIICGKQLIDYLATSFVSEVQKCFKEGQWLTTENEHSSGGTFLVGVKAVGTRGRLFRVQDDFSVIETDLGYDCIGCGDDVAKGAMFASKIHPEKRILKSLRAAEHFSAGVRGPFHIHCVDENGVYSERKVR